jgi:hypothetical protein
VAINQITFIWLIVLIHGRASGYVHCLSGKLLGKWEVNDRIEKYLFFTGCLHRPACRLVVLLELPSLDGRATNTQGYEKTNLPSHQARDEAQTIGGKIQLQMFTDLRQYFEYSMTWRIAWRHKWT